MSAVITMDYGDYSFSPVPLMTISKEYQRSPDQTILGSLIVVTLNGVVTPLPADKDGGLESTMGLQDGIRSAFDVDGGCFSVTCGGKTVFAGAPRVRNMQFDESTDNWVFTIPYTIELEFDDETNNDEDSTLHPPYIEEATDEWTIEFVDEAKNYQLDLTTISNQQAGVDYVVDNNQLYQMRVTHNITAKGKRHFSCTGTGNYGSLDKEAWEQARDYVVGRLGFDWNKFQGSGVFNFPTGDANLYDHFRTNQIGELAGTFAVTESWLVMPSAVGMSGLDRATEDFNITLRQGIDNDWTSVIIEGSIQGLETKDYGTGIDDYSITERAYSAAETYWTVVEPRIFSRVQYIGEPEANRNFHPRPITKTMGHNPSKGTISYSYEFNDRPCLFISGALSENFTIVDNYPTDVFAKLPVLGRARGPVLQAISTVTEQTREITIEVVMPPPTGCSSIADLYLNKPTGQIQTVLCDFETQLTDSYEQVFKHNDTESWNPLAGRYSRNVGWTFQNCTGGFAPDSSFC